METIKKNRLQFKRKIAKRYKTHSKQFRKSQESQGTKNIILTTLFV